MEMTHTPGLLEIEFLNEKKDVIEVVDDDKIIENVVKALSSKTRRNILEYIREIPRDVGKRGD